MFKINACVLWQALNAWDKASRDDDHHGAGVLMSVKEEPLCETVCVAGAGGSVVPDYTHVFTDMHLVYFVY